MVKRLNNWWLKFLLNRNVIVLGNRFVHIKKFTFEEAVAFVFIILPYFKAVMSLKEEFKSKSDGLLFYEVTKNYIHQMNSDDLMKASALLFGVKEKYVRELPINEVQKNLYLAFVLRDAVKVYYLFQALGVFNG